MLKIDKNEILQIFDHKDGVLYRKVSRKGSLSGPVVGKNRLGYVRVQFNKKVYLVHRLVWVLHFGEIPQGMFIDHINGRRDDNRICNLRLVTPEQNQFNRGKYKTSRSIYKGVHPQKNKFRAEIICKKKCFRLGSFVTAELAALAYNVKAIELFGAFARLNEVHFG